MAKKTRRIFDVTVFRQVDTCPDLSWLGKYSNEPTADLYIDRQQIGHMLQREYRYFNISDNYGGSAEGDRLKYLQQDYARMESYNKLEWYMQGVSAVATVTFTGQVTQRIKSGSVWGIESDSDAAYFKEIEGEQLYELRLELLAAGFTPREIREAYKKLKHREGC